MTEMVTPLLTTSSPTLVECETVIRDGLATFIEVGSALATIRDQRLYRDAGYRLFDDYIGQEWPDLNTQRDYVDKQIRAAETVKLIHTNCMDALDQTLPASEAQARPLTTLKDREQTVPLAWSRVLARADREQRRITAAMVKDVVQELKDELRAARERERLEKQAEQATRKQRAVSAPAETEPLHLNGSTPVATAPSTVVSDEPLSLAIQGAPLTPPADWYLPAEWERLADTERAAILNWAERDHRGKFNPQTSDRIEWAQWSWNPVTGCDHGCAYCYARVIANDKFTWVPADQRFTPMFYPRRLYVPRHMQVPPAAEQNVGLRNVFVGSMTDLFGQWVPQEWIDLVLAEVQRATTWNFLFLTKFPQRLAAQSWPSNAWVGTSVDTQARVANAERSFSRVTAGIKWLSCEPLLEPLRFTSLDMFDWVVIGGQTANAQVPERIPPWEWVEDLIGQARRAGCKVYLKPVPDIRPREYPRAAITR